MAKNFQGQATLPIGLRNNNPGNIRPGDNWRGMTGSNGGFVVFSDVSYGIRAMAIDLKNKINKGYNTIEKIITRWAPPTENNTVSYINSVVNSTGIAKDQKLTANTETILKLIRAIASVENGASFAKLLTDQDLLDGIALAGLPGGSAGRSAGAGVGIVVIAAVFALLVHQKIL